MMAYTTGHFDVDAHAKQMRLNAVGAIVLHVYLDPMPETMYDLNLVIEDIGSALDKVPSVRERTLIRVETFNATCEPDLIGHGRQR